MSAIDELNDTLSIDATSSDVMSVDNSDSVSIDASGKDIKTRINMSTQQKPEVRHKFIKQELKRTPESAGGIKLNTPKSRAVIDQSAIPTVESEKDVPDREIHISPINDMLGLDNPDSMLSKYVERKDKEALDWINEKQEEAAVLADENAESFNIEEEFNTVTDKRILVEDDDLDFGESSDEIEIDEIEEDNDSMENNIPEEVVENGNPDIDSIATDSTVENKVEEIEEEDIKIEDLDIEEETADETPVLVVEEEETVVDDKDDDEVIKNLQKMVTEKIKPISTQLNLSSFTIVKKPVTNINNLIADTSSRVIKWVLPNQKAVIKMKDFTGAELEKLREYSEDVSVDSLNRRFKMIYDHIVSPKPQAFDVWLKCTPYSDVDHLFFAIYVACYKGANFLPVDCPDTQKCKNTWITNDINIMDMVKFAKNEDKEEFEKIYQSEATAATGKGIYATQAVAISNKFAIAFKDPSIYDIIESAMIDNKTREKYSSFIDYLPYIDNIYAIDLENQNLIPVGYKEFPDNASRNVKSKINKYATIFNTFGADEFGPIKAYIGAIAKRTDGMSYVYPELTCPKCGKVVKSEPATAQALVFTRYQLGSLTSTLLN